MLRKTRQSARERIPVQHCSHGSSYRYSHLGMAVMTIGILECKWNMVIMAYEEWHNSYRVCSRVAATDRKRDK